MFTGLGSFQNCVSATKLSTRSSYSLTIFRNLLQSVHLSTDDRVLLFFLNLNVWMFTTPNTLILQNPRKSNVAIFMAMTTFLLICTFSFIFLYLFSIPLGFFLCFPLLFITLISHLFFPTIFSLPQLMQCSFTPQDIHVTVTSLALSVLLVY